MYCVMEKLFNRKALMKENSEDNSKDRSFQPKLDWKGQTNKEIIKDLTDKLLFTVDDVNQKDFETILKYDFDADAKNANQAVLRLFNAIVKTPEFQLI